MENVRECSKRRAARSAAPARTCAQDQGAAGFVSSARSGACEVICHGPPGRVLRVCLTPERAKYVQTAEVPLKLLRAAVP